MKKLLLLAFLPLTLVAQQQGAYPWVYSIQNDTSTGTTAFKLAKLSSGGNAVISATTDAGHAIGVCVTNCGTSGSALVAYAGLVPVIMDGTATAQHYVQISSSVTGDGHDTGATTYPTSGQVLGVVQTGCTGSGCTAMVIVTNEVQAPGSAGLTMLIPNDASTGTTTSQLAKINTSGNAVNAGTSDTAVPIYVVTSGAGTTGSATLAIAGTATCKTDAGGAAIGDFLVASTTTAGRCHDAGATVPTTGWVIGQAQTTAAANANTTVALAQGFNAAAAAAPISGPCITSGGNSYITPFFDQITPASATSFTFGNQNGATLTTNGCAQIVTQNSTTSDQANIIYASAPGANFTVIEAFRVQTAPGGGASPGAGICMFESGTSKAVMYNIAPGWGNAGFVRVAGIITSGFSQIGAGGSNIPSVLQPFMWVWTKLVYDGTNVIFSASWDSGNTWLQIETNVKGTYFTTAPDKGCFGVRPAGQHVTGTLSHFVMTTP